MLRGARRPTGPVRTPWTDRRAALVVATLLIGAAGCSDPPAPAAPLQIVEFSAEGAGGSAFGTYVMVGDLVANGARTFTDLPFRERISAVGTIAPKMSVSVVGVRPNSRVSCRITLDGRVLVENSGDVPGPDVECRAPTTTVD